MTDNLISLIYTTLESFPNSNVYVYPNCDSNEGIFTPKKINLTKLELSSNEIIIEETYFRDLIKMEVTYKGKKNIQYAKKKSVGEQCDNHLIVSILYDEIQESQFPNSSGHHTVTKIVKTYETEHELINIVSHNDILLIEIKSDRIDGSHKKQLKTELKSAIKEFF